MHEEKFLAQAIAILMGLVSAALGMAAMLQVYEAARVVAVLVVPVDSRQKVASGMRVVCVTYVALLFLAVGWLVAAIMAIDRYHEAAGNRRRLAKRFLIVTTIELAIIGLVSAAIYVLTGLA